MWSVKIWQEDGRELISATTVFLSTISREPPAIQFAFAITFAMQLFNEDSDFREFVGRIDPGSVIKRQNKIRNGVASFKEFLEEFAYFQDRMNRDRGDIYKKLEPLFSSLNARPGDTALQARFQKIIVEIAPIVPTIQRVEFTWVGSENQRHLYDIGFPDELVPADFICQLTGEVMTQPCVDTTPEHAQYVMEEASFRKALADKAAQVGGSLSHPFTRVTVDLDKIVVNAVLASKINVFVQKAEFIYDTFKATDEYPQKYQEYIEDLKNHELSLVDFKQKVKRKMPVQLSSRSRFFSRAAAVDPWARVLMNGSLNLLLSALFKECNMAVPPSPMLVDVEAVLRRICAAGNKDNLEKLLDAVDVDVNAVNSDPAKNQNTALHWVVQRANESKNNPKLSENQKEMEIEKYKACFRLLLEKGADKTLRGAAGKTLQELDEANLFADLLKPASAPAVH